VSADPRDRLRKLLEDHYACCGFRVEDGADGVVLGHGFGGVTWIGLAVVGGDLKDPAFAERLRTLSDERMPTGERCPLEILPEEECAEALTALLDELHLSEHGHVEVYSINV
jgi:hypothetical protein